MNKFQSILVLVLLIFSSFALAGTVTRSFDKSSFSAGEEITVTLKVDLTAGEDAYAIDETHPEGWEITDAGDGDLTQLGHILWVVINNAVPITFTYTLKSPMENTNIGFFNGIYVFEGGEEESISGSNSIFITNNDANECILDCSGKVCGDDSCGGSCGTCTAEKTCSTEGQCEVVATTTDSCTDSDGGIVFEIKGTTSSSNGSSYIDECISTQLLREYSCNDTDGSMLSTVKSCRVLYGNTSGCVEGACVAGETGTATPCTPACLDSGICSENICKYTFSNLTFREYMVLYHIKNNSPLNNVVSYLLQFFQYFENQGPINQLRVEGNNQYLLLKNILSALRNTEFNNLQKVSAIAYHLSQRSE